MCDSFLNKAQFGAGFMGILKLKVEAAPIQTRHESEPRVLNKTVSELLLCRHWTYEGILVQTSRLHCVKRKTRRLTVLYLDKIIHKTTEYNKIKIRFIVMHTYIHTKFVLHLPLQPLRNSFQRKHFAQLQELSLFIRHIFVVMVHRAAHCDILNRFWILLNLMRCHARKRCMFLKVLS